MCVRVCARAPARPRNRGGRGCPRETFAPCARARTSCPARSRCHGPDACAAPAGRPAVSRAGVRAAERGGGAARDLRGFRAPGLSRIFPRCTGSTVPELMKRSDAGVARSNTRGVGNRPADFSALVMLSKRGKIKRNEKMNTQSQIISTGVFARCCPLETRMKKSFLGFHKRLRSGSPQKSRS